MDNYSNGCNDCVSDGVCGFQVQGVVSECPVVKDWEEQAVIGYQMLGESGVCDG